MNTTKEIRNTQRTANDGNTVKGTAIVFNSLSQPLSGFREIIAPSAINLARDSDILALYNHDSGRVLGRTTSGTLKLNLTSRGLDFALDLPKSAADVKESLQRGDVHGCSFGFLCNSDDWSQDNNRESFARSRT